MKAPKKYTIHVGSFMKDSLSNSVDLLIQALEKMRKENPGRMTFELAAIHRDEGVLRIFAEVEEKNEG